MVRHIILSALSPSAPINGLNIAGFATVIARLPEIWEVEVFGLGVGVMQSLHILPSPSVKTQQCELPWWDSG